MEYIDEFDLVDEDAAGFPGSSPRFDHFGLGSDFDSSTPPLREPADSELAYDVDAEDVDERDEIEIDSDDSSDSDEIDHVAGISFGSWDNDGGDDNPSPLSSSPPESVDLSTLIEPEHLGDYDRDSSVSASLSASPSLVEVEPDQGVVLGLYEEDEEDQLSTWQGQFFDRWQQQHRDLVETHQRIASTLLELTEQRTEERSRFWQDTIGRQRDRRERRRSIMSNSPGRARAEVSPSPPRPMRDIDVLRARRAERRRNIMRDELVQVEVEGPQSHNRSLSRRRQTQSSAGPARTRTVAPGRPPAASAVPAFIDLTEEPDSPEGPRNGPSTTHSRATDRLHSAPSFQQLTLPSISRPTTRHTNPRRQMSLNHRTPSLTRSDASLLGNRPASPRPADVIDLTMDDDPPLRPNNRPPVPRRHGRQILPSFHNPIDVDAEQQQGNSSLYGLLHRIGFGLGTTFWSNSVTIDMQAVPTNNNNLNPLGDNRPNFNYQANGYNSGGRASSKPVHEPPAKAREGFTRNTGSAAEDVFVCPACEEELAYDPDEECPSSGPAPKKAKTKKDREEHHFWAVKECGHVFCKKCYEGRKPTKTNKSLFRSDPDHPRRVICAVDDCKSDVSNKTAWVGVFL